MAANRRLLHHNESRALACLKVPSGTPPHKVEGTFPIDGDWSSAPNLKSTKKRRSTLAVIVNSFARPRNDSLTISAGQRKPQPNHKCCAGNDPNESSYEKNANICRLRNFYFWDSFRSRGNSEPDFRPSRG